MIVCNLYYFYAFDFQPYISSHGISRYRLLMWLEYQTIWLIEIACPLTFATRLQFVKITRDMTHVFKCNSVNQRSKSQKKQLRP